MTPVRELSVTESQPALLTLSVSEADLLSSLGKSLASTSTWWGDAVAASERSVVGVTREASDKYRVTFRDVIGVVRVGSTQIHVAPKIPLEHFIYLASHSEIAPRTVADNAHLAEGDNFVELLARWCVGAAETLLRHGLRRDYEGFTEECSEIRGCIQPCETAIEAFQGRPVAVCAFEDLTDDAPLNRVVRGACERIARLEVVSERTRHDARRIAHRMDGIGPVRVSDLRVKVDRLSVSYARVIPLSMLVLTSCGVSSSAGDKVGSTFLIRTPELIEDGLRTILSRRLPEFEVAKRRLMLGTSGLSANPDLVFRHDLAIGDVKYRHLVQDWHRSDLNQIVAFATAFRTSRCALLGFVKSADAPRPRSVPMGPVHASTFAWLASPVVAPEESAALLAGDVSKWLSAAASQTAVGIERGLG